MINIEFKDNSIIITGHACAQTKGKDIVCAAVSAIIQSSICWFKPNEIKLVKNAKKPLIELTLKSEKKDNLNKLDLIKKQLEFVQKHNKKYIKIIRR